MAIVKDTDYILTIKASFQSDMDYDDVVEAVKSALQEITNAGGVDEASLSVPAQKIDVTNWIY